MVGFVTLQFASSVASHMHTYPLLRPQTPTGHPQEPRVISKMPDTGAALKAAVAGEAERVIALSKDSMRSGAYFYPIKVK